MTDSGDSATAAFLRRMLANSLERTDSDPAEDIADLLWLASHITARPATAEQPPAADPLTVRAEPPRWRRGRDVTPVAPAAPGRDRARRPPATPGTGQQDTPSPTADEGRPERPAGRGRTSGSGPAPAPPALPPSPERHWEDPTAEPAQAGSPPPTVRPGTPRPGFVRLRVRGSAPLPVPRPRPVRREPEVGLFLPGGTDERERTPAHGPGFAGPLAAPPTRDGLAMAAPAVPALRDPLLLAKALRPLARHVPAPGGGRLDETATAEVISRTGIWFPVERARSERWLRLDLVVDTGPSMVVWDDLTAELRTLFERFGIFRDVRTWSLDSRDERVRLTPYHSRDPRRAASGPGRSGNQLDDTSGRRMLLLLTDGIGPLWWSAGAGEALERWHRTGPTALLQVLPRPLWHRTGMRTASALFRGRPHSASLPGVEAAPWSLPDPSLTWLPVLEVRPDWLSTWGSLVGGVRNTWTELPALPVRFAPGAAPLSSGGGASTAQGAEARVRRFRAEVSSTAFALAGYLAAAPLSIPVMRLVQHAFLPGSDTSHLAEVFLTGLLRRTDRGGDHTPLEDLRYDFPPGVREVLLTRLTRDESLHVLDVLAGVSEQIAAGFGGTLNFHALLDASGGPGEAAIPDAARPFAGVVVSVLRGLGGRYADLAATLASRLADSAPHGAAPRRRPAPAPGSGRPASGGSPQPLPATDATRRAVLVVSWTGRQQVTNSGVLIGPRLVLTCSQGRSLLSSTTKVRLSPDSPESFTCQVHRLVETKGGITILRITDPSWKAPKLPPVRWGRVGVSPATVGPCVVHGFRSRSGPHGTLSTPAAETLTGVVDHHAVDAATVTFQSYRASPYVQGWAAAGLLGAGVWHGDLLCGVLSEGAEAHRVVARAVSAQGLVADAGCRRLLVEANGAAPVVVPIGQESLLAAPWIPAASHSAADLVSGGTGVVRFQGRRDVLDDLAAWRDDDTPVAVRVLVGPGGIGKSRAAREFLRLTHARQDWDCTWHDGESPALLDNLGVHGSRRRLIVVDDLSAVPAVARYLRRLRSHDTSGPDTGTVRLLVTSRSEPSWGRLREQTAWWGVSWSTASVRLDHTPRMWWSWCQEALADVAGGLAGLVVYDGVDWPALAASIGDWRPSDRSGESTMSMHMAALGTLLDAAYEDDTESQRVADTLLQREKSRWYLLRTRLPHSYVDKAVACSSLVPARDRADAQALLSAGLSGLMPGEHDATLDWLPSVCPPVGESSWWGGLMPERLGEHLVVQVLMSDAAMLKNLLGVRLRKDPTGEARRAAAEALVSRLAPSARRRISIALEHGLGHG